MDEPVKRATISAGRHPSGLYGRVDPYKSHLSIASKSNEANTDRYLKKIKPRESFKNRLTASQQAKVNRRDNAGAAPETRFCSKYVLLNKDWRRIAMEIAFTDPQP